MIPERIIFVSRGITVSAWPPLDGFAKCGLGTFVNVETNRSLVEIGQKYRAHYIISKYVYTRGSQTFLVRGTLFRYAKYSGTSLI